MHETANSGDMVLGIILIFAGFAVYFLPAIIASQRGVARQSAIFALNLLLGWTLLGWVGALVWSLAEPAGNRPAPPRPSPAPLPVAAPALDSGITETPTVRRLSDEQEEMARSFARTLYPCAIAGIGHANRDGTSRALALARLPVGAVLRLRPERDNPVDPRAVSVWRDDMQLGYVPADQDWIGEALAEGKALAGVLARVEEAGGLAIRARMLVAVLPGAAPAEAERRAAQNPPR